MKKKNIIIKWQYPCLAFVLISFYVIMSNFIPEIRIPNSVWDEDTTETFNGIMTSLSISYITGMLVYILTVVYKNHKERTKRRWELDAIVTELNRALEPLEESIGRFDITDASSLRKIADDTFTNFKENLTTTLNSVHFCKDIMNEEEYERISDIRRALSILINLPSAMGDVEAEMCLQALRDIRTNINEFQKSVYHMMWQNNNKEKPRNKNSICH